MYYSVFILIFIHLGTCTIINYNGGRTFSYLYRSLVPSLPYLVIVFCYSNILGTFRRVQHRMDMHRASVISKVRNLSKLRLI